MNSGVYSIYCLENGRYYVGRSNQLDIRKKDHFHNLKLGTHCNKFLQSVCDKYGSWTMTFNVLEHCEESELEAKEQLLLDACLDDPNCMNFAASSGGGRGFGFKHSEETKAKIAAKAIGRKHTEPRSEEYREKLRKNTTKLWESEEYRAKIKAAQEASDYVVSDETKALQSSQRRGRVLSEEWKRKISESLKAADREITPEGMEILKNLHTQKTSVKNIVTNEVFIFNSRQEAATFAGCSRDVVTRSIQEPEWEPRRVPHFRFSNT